MKTLDLHTLQFLRKKFQEPNLRYQSQKGGDFSQGEAYILSRIDEVLANAIELAGGPEVKPESEPEPEIPWDEMEDWVQFIAMDANNQWFKFEHEPEKLDRLQMWGKSHGQSYIAYNIPFTAPDWRTSLRQRPKTNEQC